MKLTLSILLTLSAVLGLAGCSDDVSRDEVIEGLTEDADVSEEEAGCIYDSLADTYGDEELQIILQADTDEDIADGGLDVDAASEAVFSAFFDCVPTP